MHPFNFNWVRLLTVLLWYTGEDGLTLERMILIQLSRLICHSEKIAQNNYDRAVVENSAKYGKAVMAHAVRKQAAKQCLREEQGEEQVA